MSTDKTPAKKTPAKKPVAKKPVAKKPVAKKPVAKKAVKFEKDSVEGITIRGIKSRQKKIDNAGITLVALWHAQGKELNELQMILECSARELEKHTGLKRTAINTYMNISQDPRLGEPETAKQLGQFTQKQLLTLATLDEDEFNESVKTGNLPKSSTESATPAKPTATTTEEKPEPTVEWKQELFDIVSGAVSIEDAEAKMSEYFGSIVDVEVEPETVDESNPDRALLIQALGATGENDITSQATELGVKPKALKKALDEGKITQTIIDKCNEYLAD